MIKQIDLLIARVRTETELDEAKSYYELIISTVYNKIREKMKLKRSLLTIYHHYKDEKAILKGKVLAKSKSCESHQGAR